MYTPKSCVYTVYTTNTTSAYLRLWRKTARFSREKQFSAVNGLKVGACSHTLRPTNTRMHEHGLNICLKDMLTTCDPRLQITTNFLIHLLGHIVNSTNYPLEKSGYHSPKSANFHLVTLSAWHGQCKKGMLYPVQSTVLFVEMAKRQRHGYPRAKSAAILNLCYLTADLKKE